MSIQELQQAFMEDGIPAKEAYKLARYGVRTVLPQVTKSIERANAILPFQEAELTEENNENIS